jgi:hypothetical protein
MIDVLEHILADLCPIAYRDSLFEQLNAGADGWPSALAAPVRSALERHYLATHDPRRGGLLQSHKYLDRNTVESGLFRARREDAMARRMAPQTLEGSLTLIDLVWGGGAYQCAPLMAMEAHPLREDHAGTGRMLADLRASLPSFGDVRYRRAAEAIHRCPRTFLRGPDGAFST